MAQPAFYYLKTLLGGMPDVNRRTIYAADTESPVKTFNADMKRWTSEMEAELQKELKALNDLAPAPFHGRSQ